MASIAGPRIIEDGLILHLDAANPRSYRGPTAFNAINSAVNSFPMTGNSWDTFQVNQYNSNQYFSIGGVQDITNNIVTMTGPHPLRTYDAVRPQTSGGGVTAGIDYFVKKISATAFSLHTYSNVQNGTLGFSVLDPISNDQRQSLTATNFPTMWWGAPHLPNSDTIKTILPRGFDLEGRVHDCVRINWFRPDGVGCYLTRGGMAYGVTPVLDAGTTYTWSFYHKAGNERSLGQTGQFQIYFSSNATSRFASFVPGAQWNRLSFSAQTPGITSSTILMYWFTSTGISITSGLAYDIAEIQVEKRLDSTPFLPTTRGSTAGSGGGFNDLTPSNNQLEVVNGSGYTAQTGGGIVLDGIDDYIITTEAKGLPLGNSSRTISIWTKFSTLKNNFVQLGSAPDQRYIFECADFSGTVYLFTDGVNGGNNIVISGSEIPALNVWNNLVFSNSGQNWKYYINGSLVKSGTFPITLNTGGNKILVGERDDISYDNMNGTISMVSIYNRALSDGEVKQNFNASRKRFGI
jgi:hypothetical protein